jgi:hypothetical protein
MARSNQHRDSFFSHSSNIPKNEKRTDSFNHDTVTGIEIGIGFSIIKL